MQYIYDLIYCFIWYSIIDKPTGALSGSLPRDSSIFPEMDHGFDPEVPSSPAGSPFLRATTATSSGGLLARAVGGRRPYQSNNAGSGDCDFYTGDICLDVQVNTLKKIGRVGPFSFLTFTQRLLGEQVDT